MARSGGAGRIARSGGKSLGSAAAAVGAAETWAGAGALAFDCEIEIARFAARLTGGLAVHCTASLVLRHPSPR